MRKTWNHPAVRRFFDRHATTAGPHVVREGHYPVEPYGAAHVVHAYLLRGPFDPSVEPDLSHRARASIRTAVFVFVTHEAWCGEIGITYVDDEADANDMFDGFTHLMERQHHESATV